jgi:hypothetical protein
MEINMSSVRFCCNGVVGILIAVPLLLAGAAVAEVRISLVGVLDRLSATYNIAIEGHTKLDRPVSGNFSGPLENVLADLLDTSSFVVRRSNGRLVVQVMRTPRSAGSAVATAPTAEPSPLPTPAAAAGPNDSHQTVAARPFSASGPAVTHSPEAQQLAKQILGPDVPPLQIDEHFFRAYANRASRADNRYRGGVQ